MSESVLLLDTFSRGIAVGAMSATVIGVLRSRVSPQAKLATSLLGLSVSFWAITEAEPLWRAMGRAEPLIWLAMPAAGLFWLFVATVFDDRPIRAWMWAPAGLLFLSGLVMWHAPQPLCDTLWVIRNLSGAALGLHSGYLVLRGWRGDLLEARRRLRAVVLAGGVLFALSQAFISFAYRLDPRGPWLDWTTGHVWGGALLTILMLSCTAVFLQARPGVFGVVRRLEAADPRAEAADRQVLQRLEAVMAAGAWRREGLTIGGLAGELDVPEHRLRRLINNRLGHRNFADFLNSRRIAAARDRLSDPRDAATTVAAIAFDLGYGSLGPFNRAFREATGATPSEWRRRTLAEGSPELKEAV